MGWMDILICIIFIISSIKGWKRGLLLSALQFGGFFIAGAAAKKYYPIISEFLLEQPILINLIRGQISKPLQSAFNVNAIPGSIIANQNIFQRLGLPQWLEGLFMGNETIKAYSIGMQEGAVSYISDILSKVVINFLSIFIVFIGVKMILSIISYMLDVFGKHSILRKWNKFGGLLFGLAKGLLTVFILLGLFVPILTITASPILIEGLEESVFARTLYDYNPVMWFIQGEL